VIEEDRSPLAPNEIWESAVAKGYEKELNTKGKTPWNTLGAQLYVDVRDNPNSLFLVTDSRPKRFFLHSLVADLGTKALQHEPATTHPKTQFQEKDLHPFLVYYGYYYLKAFLKTIHHNKSGKKQFGEWVHPDIVGCYFPFNDWKDEVVDVSSLMGNTAVKLFSFELKRELSISNLREAFFQAVSNSSWANEGFLAAATISTDDEFRNELERLSTSFGIGVIRIDVEDPDSTEVYLPAKPKDQVDWETVNKLATLNPEFRDFLKRVKNDIASKEIRSEGYDKVIEKEELIKSITKAK
jgi:hypothetical protein